MPRQATDKVTNIDLNKRGRVVLKLDDIRPDIVEARPANDKTNPGYWPLKLWLYGVITVNLVHLLNIVIARYIHQSDIYLTTSALIQLTPIMIFASLANVIFAFALLQFQKWGFWGLMATGFSMLIVQINFGIATIFTVTFTLFGLSILYGLLRPGGKNDAWFKLV
jgi:hypothetical protein